MTVAIPNGKRMKGRGYVHWKMRQYFLLMCVCFANTKRILIQYRAVVILHSGCNLAFTFWTALKFSTCVDLSLDTISVDTQKGDIKS